MNQIKQINDYMLIQLLIELWHPNNIRSVYSPTAVEHYFYSNTSYWLCTFKTELQRGRRKENLQSETIPSIGSSVKPPQPNSLAKCRFTLIDEQIANIQSILSAFFQTLLRTLKTRPKSSVLDFLSGGW